VDFQGSFSDGRGAGTWRFSPSAEFVSDLRKTYRELSTEQVFKLAIHDVSRPFMSAMQAEGYSGISLDDFTRMRIHGVDADYVQRYRKAGYDKLTTAGTIKTRIHGATPAFAQDAKRQASCSRRSTIS
jgi:hypothetical protein